MKRTTNPSGSFSASISGPITMTSLESSNSPELEPMQIGRTRLTPEERQLRFDAKECFYGGQRGHYVTKCLSLND